MEGLVSTRDIFISTQQSGTSGSNGNTNTFSSFKVCFNTNNLKCEADEFMRLSITQFNLYRNFYFVNSSNDLLNYKTISGTNGTITGTKRLTNKDYGNIGDIAVEFSNIIKEILDASTSVGNFAAGTPKPLTNFNIGGTGFRLFDNTYTLAGHGVTTFNLQTPQYTNSFSDSFALLGGKRISTDDNVATSSFNITIEADTIRVQGYYPMQRTTMPYLYLRSELNGGNLETQNLGNFETTPSTHIIQSSIVSKIPVGDETCTLQTNEISPYFVDIDSNFVSEINFQVVDQHGRKIPDVAGDNTIETQGNLFCDMTLKVSVYKTGTNPNLLNTNVAPFSRFAKNNQNLFMVGNNPYAPNKNV